MHPKFYWYKSGGWVLAVDAVSIQDARAYVKATCGSREFEYLGHYGCPATTTATCGITSKRQDEIVSNNARWA